jgi:DNA-binding SARP family transcriptional activator
MLARATACAQRLHAGVLVTWAEAGRALVAARAATTTGSVPATLTEQARRVDAQARALGVPGAQAVTLATLALTSAGSRRPGLSREAAALARDCGLRPAARAEPAVLVPEQRRPSRSPAAPPARLALLGGFVLEVGGRQPYLTPLRPRARALLHLLALRHGRDVHRERLIEDLWPGVDPGAGRRRLQVAVSSVRQALEGAGLAGTAILMRRGDGYSLDIPGAAVDIADFDRALVRAAADAGRHDAAAALGHRLAALDIYRGELLPEAGPADWVVSERERLRLSAAIAAEDAARDSQALGDTATALRVARRSVELDPFRDLAWVLLAELHEQVGDLSAATVVRLEHERVRARLGASFPDADWASGRQPG